MSHFFLTHAMATIIIPNAPDLIHSMYMHGGWQENWPLIFIINFRIKPATLTSHPL